MKFDSFQFSTNLWDKLGISASFICVLHCLALPFLVPLIALPGLAFISSETFESAMLIFAVAVASYSLIGGYCARHRKVLPLILFALGAVVIFLSKYAVEESYEPVVLPLGAAFFMVAHAINWRLNKTCPNCAKEKQHAGCTEHD